MRDKIIESKDSHAVPATEAAASVSFTPPRASPERSPDRLAMNAKLMNIREKLRMVRCVRIILLGWSLGRQPFFDQSCDNSKCTRFVCTQWEEEPFQR